MLVIDTRVAVGALVPMRPVERLVGRAGRSGGLADVRVKVNQIHDEGRHWPSCGVGFYEWPGHHWPELASAIGVRRRGAGHLAEAEGRLMDLTVVDVAFYKDVYVRLR